MNKEFEDLIDSILKKLKKSKSRKINLKDGEFEKFIDFLIKDI